MIGAHATAFVEPQTVEQLQEIVNFTHINHVPMYVLGKGTHVLLKPYVPGLIISLNNLKKYSIDQHTGIIESEAGVPLIKLALSSLDNKLTGFEFAIGIPGTVAGGIVTAAAYPLSHYQ